MPTAPDHLPRVSGVDPDAPPDATRGKASIPHGLDAPNRPLFDRPAAQAGFMGRFRNVARPGAGNEPASSHVRSAGESCRNPDNLGLYGLPPRRTTRDLRSCIGGDGCRQTDTMNAFERPPAKSPSTDPTTARSRPAPMSERGCKRARHAPAKHTRNRRLKDSRVLVAGPCSLHLIILGSESKASRREKIFGLSARRAEWRLRWLPHGCR